MLSVTFQRFHGRYAVATDNLMGIQDVSAMLNMKETMMRTTVPMG